MREPDARTRPQENRTTHEHPRTARNVMATCLAILKKIAFIRFGRRHVLMVVALIVAWYVWQYFTPANRAARQRLSEADEKSTAAMTQRLNPVTQLFAKGRKGAKGFADEALSFSGKIALVKGMLRIGQGDAHAEFLKEAFARHVFSEAELTEALTAAVRGYLIDLDGVESEMLVKLRADLADLDHSGQAMPSYLRSEEEFRSEYQRLAAQTLATMKLDGAVTVGREIGLWVASDVATQMVMQVARGAAAEMGVGAGILGAGAASAVETLGVGMVVGFILDAFLDSVFKSLGYDPAAKIAGQVQFSLDRLETALTEDTFLVWFGKKGTLREQLEKLHEIRSKLRRQTIAKFMKERS